ncbi:MAG TPA: TRAP transporter large permease subunit [Planctomycetota bacterium]|nr:TRAP transporter large permease subunit [Planctomycetota bacterium]
MSLHETASLTLGPAPKWLPARVVAGLEKWTIVAILGAMAVLPTLEVLGRKLLGRGVPGGQVFVQHLTLCIGFLGALLATRAGKHLALATGDLLPEGKLRAVSGIYVNTIAAATCAFLAAASVTLVRVHMSKPLRDMWSEFVMPAALVLMAARFIWRAGGWPSRAAALALVAAACAAGHFGAERIADDDAWAAALQPVVWPGVGAILFAVVLGMPVFAAMGAIAMLLFTVEGSGIVAVPTETYRLVASPTLPAIPLLTAAGYVLAEGGASRRLVRLARAVVGWMPGGMALMVCFVCAGFTTFTGGSGVTILALGGLMLPMLLEEKYPEGFSLGLVTSSGSLGLLFPPSLPVILYAVVAGQASKANPPSVEELYIAGFFPCLLLLVLVALYGIFMGVRSGSPRTPFSWKEAGAALWAAKWEIAIPVIVVSSIFGGYATMVESAAIAVVLAVISQSFIFRDLDPARSLPVVLEHAATLVGAVVILLGIAMGLTAYLVDAEVPKVVLEWTKAHIESQTTFLLVLNVALLVLGSVLEIYSAIVILAPLLAPMAVHYKVDPLHMGVIFLANLELGFLFPPMGLNLILSSARFNQRLTRLYKVALPFLAIMALGVLLITYVPAMTTGFLHWVRPR